MNTFCKEQNMDKLPVETIDKAFLKTSEENPIKEGKLTLIKKEHYDKVVQFLREEFFPSEYVSKAVDCKWNPELEAMFLATLQLNLSLMLLDEENGDVIGLRLMGVGKEDDDYPVDQFSDPGMKKTIAFWNFGKSKTNFFIHYNTKESIVFFGLGVKTKYRQRGIASLLVDLSLKFLKNLDMSPIYITTGASSLYSMRIFEKFGFELLAEVKYDEFRMNGELVIKSTVDNTCLKSYGKVV